MNTSKPHIVVLTPGFPINETDTSCLPFLQSLITALKSKINFTVVCENHPIKENYTWHGIPVITLRKNKWIGRALARLTITSKLTDLNRKNRINGLHCFWLNWAAVSADSWCLNNQVPMWLTLCGQEPSLPKKWTKIFNALNAKKFAVSNFQRQVLMDRGMPTQMAIPWHLRSEWQKLPRVYDLVWCGSFIEVKRPEWFIEIILLLKQKGWNGKALMIGPDLANKFDGIINSAALSQNILLTGLVNVEEVIYLMQQSRILLHTATYEAFGRVLAEALSCGCQVVSTPVGLAYDEPMIHKGNTKEDLAKLCYDLLSHQEISRPVNQHVLPEDIYVSYYLESASMISE